MKNCKGCNAQLDRTAKVCPQCGRDQRSWFGRHKIITGILIFFILGTLGSLFSSEEDNGDNLATSPKSSVSESSTDTTPPASEKEPEKEDLELISESIKADEFSRSVVGQIKNNSDKKYGYVQIEINLYDDNGNRVGSTLDNINNLEPGGTWNFEAMILEDSCTKYKIVDISGF